MTEELSFNVALHNEEVEGKPVYVADYEMLSISDFGDSPEEAIENLKTALRLLFSVEPEKAEYLKKDNNILITRVSL